MRIICIILLIAAGFLSCSSSSTSKSTYTRSANVIYEEEIQSQSAISAYDLISRLRPHWIQGRGLKSLRYPEVSYPMVYVDGNRYGTIESLHNLPAVNITMIEYMSPSETSVRYSSENVSGIIMITYFY